MNSSVERPGEPARLRQTRPDCSYGDFIGSLPLELLLQIVEYLDPRDIVRCQRMRNWLVGLHRLILTGAVLGLETMARAIHA